MKHSFYIILTSFLGLLLAGIVHALIETLYLNAAVANENPVVWRYYLVGRFPCALPPVVFYGLPVLGILGGFFIGRVWWRWVYVPPPEGGVPPSSQRKNVAAEGRHWRRKRR